MPKHVKSAFDGKDGIMEGLSKDKIWIDHSTTDYEQMMDFNEQVITKQAVAIEAPVTGGLEALKKGQMTVLLAGPEERVDEVYTTSCISQFHLQLTLEILSKHYTSPMA